MNEIVSPDKETLGKISSMETWADELYIDTQANYALATEGIRKIKRIRADVVEFFKDMKQKAHEAHAAICTKEKALTSKCDTATKDAKAAMIGFQKAESVRVEAERKRLQAEAEEKARKEREAAEAEAEKQRQIEAAAREKAEAAMRKAEAAANEIEKERLRVEAEKADADAREASIKAREEREAAAAVEVETVKAAPVLPSKDTYIKKHWKAKLLHLRALVDSAAAGNSVALAFLSFDQKTADTFARKDKEKASCPGVEFYADESLATKK